jgi:hypothetical protein
MSIMYLAVVGRQVHVKFDNDPRLIIRQSPTPRDHSIDKRSSPPRNMT